MDAFALLKYWRSGGGVSGGATIITAADTRAAAETVATDNDVGPHSSDGEDGPYFDLEFPHESDEGPPTKSPGNPHETASEDEETESGEEEEEDDDDDEEGELKFALASGECTDHGTAALSPSDEVFFRGDLVSIENSKLPVFLAKSATRFRVLLLKLKKSKSGGERNEDEGKNEKSPSGKFTAVKYRVDEGPLLSLFTRDSSSKESGNCGKGQKGNFTDDSSVSDSTAERKLTKEMVQKYLKMVKPFYVRVSKRYVEKLRFPGNAAPPKGSAAAARADPRKGHNLQSGLKVVRKHLGKSRSASAAATAASNRRETSLPDGIEGAILHCKRSFNASGRDAAESSSILCRSASDPSGDKSAVVPKTASFSGEAKETKRLGLD